MEERESSDRIRPLPPEAPPEPSPQGPRRSRRGWVPLAVAGAALGVFAVGSALFARSEPMPPPAVATLTTTTTTTVPPLAEVPPATTTTTTIPSPPVLAARIPDATQVRVVLTTAAEASIELWSVGDREPVTFAAGPPITEAAFNADGSLVATLSYGGAENGTLRIGEPARIGTRFVGVTSMSWHDTDPARIAFVATLPLETVPSLLTGTVAPDNYELSDVGRLPIEGLLVDGGDVQIAAWGEWGFAVNAFEPLVVSLDDVESTLVAPLTVVLDPDGVEQRRSPGWVVDSLAGGRFLVRTFWDVVDATEDGVPIVIEQHEVTRTDSTLEPNGRHSLLTADSVAFFNPNGSHMSEVTVNLSGVTLVTSRNFDRPSNRSASAAGVLTPVGFTGDGARFVLHDIIEDELVFLDWSNGTQHRLPTGGGLAVAVDAR